MESCVLDDRVTPADYATVSEALGSLGPLADPYRVLGALSCCGVVVPNGLNSLVLLCRAEGVATGIDGAWPMDPNDFLKIFAAVRRKLEIDEDNLCDTLEASRFLVSMASQRAASETLDRPTTPPGVLTSPHLLSTSQSRAFPGGVGSPPGGSSLRRGSFNGNATPTATRYGPVSRAGSVVSVTPGAKRKSTAVTGTPAIQSSLRLAKGATSTRRAVVTVKEHDHSSSGGASQAPAMALDGDQQSAAGVLSPNPSIHHAPSLRRSKSASAVTFRSQTEIAQRELAHSLRDAVTEIRTRQRAAAAAERALKRRLGDNSDDDDDDASSVAAAVPADILATTVTVAEMQLLCDGLGIDPTVFEQHLKEKSRLEKLMSFAKPKSQRLHEKLQKKKAASMRTDVSMSLGALASSDDDDDDDAQSDSASSSGKFTTANASPEGRIPVSAMSPASASPLLVPSSATRLDTSMSVESGALMSFKLSRTATQMRRHRPSISAKYAGASVNIVELSQWIATPSTNANANTPRTSARAKARWRRCLDVIRAKGQRARSSWNDLSANIRRLVQARRAAAEGGVATANFDLTSTTDAITERLNERCRLHEERVVAKRVSLKPAPEIEGADAVLNSMPAARGNNELMLRQLCTPCFGPSRACIMARRLREWRQGPTGSRCDDDLSNGSRSPDDLSRTPSPPRVPSPQPQWLVSGSHVGRQHGARHERGGGGGGIAFAAFDDGGGTASLAHDDATSFQMAVNAPSQDQLDVISEDGTAVHDENAAPAAADAPPSPRPAAPAADVEPPPAVDASQMARWTAGGTHVERRRPPSASRPGSAAGRRPGPSPSPSLGPKGGPATSKASELAQLVADNRRAAQLERSFQSLGSTTTISPTAQRRAQSRPRTPATSPDAAVDGRAVPAHHHRGGDDYLPQRKPSPLASSPFKNRRRIAAVGSPAAGSRPTSAAGRRPSSSRPASAASVHRS